MTKFDINNLKLKIQSPGINVDESLNEFILEQIEKLGKIFSKIERCEIMLRIEKSSKLENCEVESKIFVPGKILFSINKSDNFRMASKMVFEDLQVQLTKYKSGLTDKSGSATL